MLWGDPDPNFATTSDVLYDFDSTLELRREFIEALYTNAGGVPGFKLDGGRWDQPTNERRSGRMYVLSFSILSSIDSEPYIYLPFATATTSGVRCPLRSCSRQTTRPTRQVPKSSQRSSLLPRKRLP